MRKLAHRSTIFGIVESVGEPIEIDTRRGKLSKIKVKIRTIEQIRHPGSYWQNHDCFYTIILLGTLADRACIEIRPGIHIYAQGFWQTRLVEEEGKFLPIKELRGDAFSVMRDVGDGNFIADTPTPLPTRKDLERTRGILAHGVQS